MGKKMPKLLGKSLLSKIHKDKTPGKLPLISSSESSSLTNDISSSNNNSSFISNTTVLLNDNREERKSNSSSILGGDDITTNSSNADDFDSSLNDKIATTTTNLNQNNENNIDDDDDSNRLVIIMDKENDSRISKETVVDQSLKSTLKTSRQIKTKTELKRVEEKISKCKYEITALQHKLQNEWSNHVRNKYESQFYEKSHQSSDITSKPLIMDYCQIDKNIEYLNEKLKVYEKRREKLLKKQEKSSDQESASSSNCSTNIATQHADGTQQQQNSSPTINVTTSSTVANVNTYVDSQQQQQQGSKTKSLNRHEILPYSNVPKSASIEDLVNTTAKQHPQTTSNSKLVHNNSTTLLANQSSNEDQQMASGAAGSSTSANHNNVHFQTNEFDNSTNSYLNSQNQKRDYPMLLQFEQEFYFLKDQQLKLQIDLENIQKKMNENAELIAKEIKSDLQAFDQYHGIRIDNVEKSNQIQNQKLDMLIQALQSLDYKLVKHNTKVQEDISVMKSKIESSEQSQNKTQRNNFDNSTDYYQIFTKLFDIILTLCAIFLLVLNNTATFIKYIFSSSPRCITFSIIFYVIIYNYFNCEHWSFLSKYFEQYDELKSNNNITNDGNLQDSKMKNFFLINKIYQFFNFLYEYIFKPSVTI